MRSEKKISKPRLGFLGIGWIGRNRMEAIARNGLAEITAIADPSAELRERIAPVRYWKTSPWPGWISKMEPSFSFRVSGHLPSIATR
jgi:predicted dehydrogenase